MSATSHGDPYSAWLSSLSASTASVSAIESWQDRRFRFAHRTAELLTAGIHGSPSVTGPVVYGIHLDGAGLVYIGQTREAERRLRDLPVGESHHLANTIPPELWERVIVVQWPRLVEHVPSAEQDAIRAMGPAVCGLALEHLLQVREKPPLNSRRRTRSGEWRLRQLAESRSQGARHASVIPALLAGTLEVWHQLRRIPRTEDGVATLDDVGRVVFPATALETLGPGTS